MTWGRWYWPTALGAVAAILLGPEAYALATDWRNTLSYWFWTLLRVQYGAAISTRSFAWYATLVIYAGLVVWLGGHLWFKWWRG